MLRNFRRGTSSSSSQADMTFKDVGEDNKEAKSQEVVANDNNAREEGGYSPVLTGSPNPSPKSGNSSSRHCFCALIQNISSKQRSRPSKVECFDISSL